MGWYPVVAMAWVVAGTAVAGWSLITAAGLWVGAVVVAILAVGRAVERHGAYRR